MTALTRAPRRGSRTWWPSRTGVLAAAAAGLVAPLVLVTPATASPTANEVVYVADDDNDGVYAIVVRDLESRRATTVLPADDAQGWLYDDPELSPDGSLIVFQTDRGNAAGRVGTGLAVVRRDGTGFRRLTAPPESQTVLGADLAPAWSPDGATVLFTRLTTEDSADGATSTESSALYTVPVGATTSTTPTAVPGGAGGLTADWSPNGDRIVFTNWNPADGENGRRGTGPLTVINADGTGRRTLGAVGVLPRWSPTGDLIAYTAVTDSETVRDRGDYVTQIATVPAAGGTPNVFASTRPTGARTAAEYPAWTPDGEGIVFDLYGYDSSGNAQAGDLWAVDRRGARAGRVTGGRGDELQAHVHGPKPAPVVKPAGETGTRYVPVTPRRVLDTREGLGAPAGKVGAGDAAAVRLAVRGLETSQGAVPANAAAVVLNVTVTGATAATDVRVYPSGSGVPGASNLNAVAGQTVPNLVTATIGSDGAVMLRNSGGSVHLIADLAGYYVPTDGVGFTALDPARIADSRHGHGLVSNKIPGGGFGDLQVTGRLTDVDGRAVEVPPDATAVVLNITGTGTTRTTDLRIYPTPADDSVPEVSNLNLRAGETAANLVTVAVGQNGKVRIRNAAGAVDVIADLAGYYSPGSAGRFVPVVPARFVDTRSGVGTAPIPVTATGTVDPRVAGARGVPAGATAAVLNLTGTGVSATTDVRAYPAGASRVPTVSNLNLTRGATRANLAIVRTGTDGRVVLRNAGGQVNLIGDLAGYIVG